MFLLPVLLSQLETSPLDLGVQVLPTYQLNAVISGAVFGGAGVLDSVGRLSYLGALGIALGGMTMWLMDQERAVS